MNAMQLDLFGVETALDVLDDNPRAETSALPTPPAPPAPPLLPQAMRSAEHMSAAAMLLGHVRFLINTPVITAALQELVEWLLGGVLGGAFVGLPRLGKTRAARYCLRALPHLLGFSIPYVEIPIRMDLKREIRSKNDFFSHLLKRVGHITKRSNSSDKHDRFVEYCVAQAKRSGANMFILYFDEAQKLSADQLTWILECANEVEVEGCRLFILLTAQTDFHDLRERLVRGEQEQFVARFMLGEFAFRGLRCEEEVEVCLDNYATTEYPAASGRTFAANYLATAPDPALNLKSLTKMFMYEFGLLWKAKISDTPLEIPMHYFTAAVIRFMIYRGDPTHWNESDADLVHQAVNRSKFATAVDVRASAKKAGQGESADSKRRKEEAAA